MKKLVNLNAQTLRGSYMTLMRLENVAVVSSMHNGYFIFCFCHAIVESPTCAPGNGCRCPGEFYA
jgi:hypothetical protein